MLISIAILSIFISTIIMVLTLDIDFLFILLFIWSPDSGPCLKWKVIAQSVRAQRVKQDRPKIRK